MKKIIAIGVVFIISIVTISLIMFINYSNNTVTLKILVTPTNSSIKINGSSSTIGIHHIKPGNYKITVSYPGFASQSKTFSVNKNSTKFVGIILQPNSATTANFYQINGYQEQMVEAISSNNNVSNSKAEVKNEPIIKYLPYVGPSLQYTIGYKVDPNNSTTPYITITSSTPQGRQNALSFIRSKGIDPTFLNIVFINQQPSAY